MRLLEPSMGQGDFLTPAINRLLGAYRAAVTGQRKDPTVEVGSCIRAVELHQSTYDVTRTGMIAVLRENGLTAAQAEGLAAAWLRRGDFLLEPFEGTFTHVIGNPLYVRQELIPDALMTEYRRRFINERTTSETNGNSEPPGQRENGGGGDGGDLDPVIRALVQKIPPSSAPWGVDEQVMWLRMMAMAFNMTYGGKRQIEIEAETEASRLSSTLT